MCFIHLGLDRGGKAGNWGFSVDGLPRSDELARLRQKMAWYLAQAEECESGRPEAKIENGIVAARRSAEMAAKYRGWADDLAVMIEAYTEEDARESKGIAG
jgi:hypothetical protein